MVALSSRWEHFHPTNGFTYAGAAIYDSLIPGRADAARDQLVDFVYGDPKGGANTMYPRWISCAFARDPSQDSIETTICFLDGAIFISRSLNVMVQVHGEQPVQREPSHGCILSPADAAPGAGPQASPAASSLGNTISLLRNYYSLVDCVTCHKMHGAR